MKTYDVVIVGAGPVGLCLAGLLGRHEIRTLLIERRFEPTRSSRAIGITPPSLRILDELSVSKDLVSAGVPVLRAHVHGSRRYLGRVSFETLPGAYQFILSVPQAITESLLVDRVERIPNVTVVRGETVLDVVPHDGSTVIVRSDGNLGEVRGSFVCGCDGPGSVVRDSLGASFHGRSYRRFFFMGDYRDRSALGEDAHLWFTPWGAVESFPLPGNTRRWIVQRDPAENREVPDVIEALVAERAGVCLSSDDLIWHSAFEPERYRSSTLARGRVFLCGDAAHVMAPIGAQGMNTGFADAKLTARLIIELLTARRNEFIGGADAATAYERLRRPAIEAATGRAAISMRVGTITGTVASLFRNAFIRGVLSTPARRLLPPHFAMQTIPLGDVENVRIR